ncbi:MAG: hypothetical protein HWE13_07165 [Gammaproteobacteria bacterium]|nr:hypothetical protein [Gammaproteobacteria bacterium]NVK87888.1 hypothetical protein [Gammaproteobacteria bacterium]
MKTITVVTKNYRGLIADISECLSQNDVNIEQINADQSDTTALVRVVTNDNDRAFQILADHNFNPVSYAGVLVKVFDQPGALAKLSRQLSEQGIDIRGINMVEQHDGFNIVSISSSDDTGTRELLGDIVV